MNTVMTMDVNAEIIAHVDAVNRILEERNAVFQIRVSAETSGSGVKKGLVLVSDFIKPGIAIHPEASDWMKSDEEIAEKLEDIFRTYAAEFHMEDYMDPDAAIRRLIVPKALSAEQIPELNSRGIVYTQKMDLAFSFYLPVRNFPGRESQNVSIQVTDNMLRHAEMTLEEAGKCAEANFLSEIKFLPLSEVLSDVTGEAVNDSPLWLLGNQSDFHGAGALISDRILRIAAKRMRTEWMYILPSSIHEVLCISRADAKCDPYELLEMVKDINATQLREEEKLTDNVYRFAHGKLSALV